MVERPERERVGDHPRAATESEWEVFVREDEDAPMRHVGSVTAPSTDVAHEQAGRLFGWYATAIWVCPAAEVRRYAAHDLDDDAQPVAGPAGTEGRTVELGDIETTVDESDGDEPSGDERPERGARASDADAGEPTDSPDT